MSDIRIVAQVTSVVNVTPLAEASQAADNLTPNQGPIFMNIYAVHQRLLDSAQCLGKS